MNEPLENSADQTTGATQDSILLRGCFAAIFGMVIFAVFVSLIVPQGGSRPAARRSQCLNNMRQIGIATMNYASQHDGQIPHVNIVDHDGAPIHSWRTTLLPHLDRAALHRAIDKSQPWDSEVNLEFTTTPLEVFKCPDAVEFKDADAPTTNYFTVVDRQTPFPTIVDTEKHPTGHVTLDYISNHDGQTQTFGFVEASGQNFWWAEPKDIPFSDIKFGISNPNGRGISSGHPAGGVNVIFLDGHGKSLSKDIDLKVLKAMCTIDNFENEVKIPEEEF